MDLEIPINNPNELDPKIDFAISKKNKSLIFFLVLTVVIVLFLISYIPRLIHWHALEEEAEIINPLIVSVIKVHSEQQPGQIVLPSTTQALRETPIWARVNGYIKEFYVDIGDHVEQDQLLMEIATPETDKELAQAEADYATALAKLEIAKISAARWENIYSVNSQAISPQEVDERKSTLQATHAEVNSAAANVQRLQKIVGFNKLYAPFSGVITTRNIDLGTLITAGSAGNLQQLYQLAKIDIIRVFADVPQTYFRAINVGDEVEVKILEFPERIFKGIIARTAKALTPVARTLLTEIHVDNKEELLITGLYAEVTFNLIPKVPYFIIPTTALIIRAGHPHLAIVNDKRIVHLQQVQLGRDYGKTIEIITGLKENDQVVINPNEKIVEGATVEITED